MRLVFAGTPPFAAAALSALIDAARDRGWTIAGVLSQPDRPAGRGMKLVASAVKTLALAHQLPVATPLALSLKKGGEAAEAAQRQIAQWQPDVLVVAAYGLILPQAVLDIPHGIAVAGGARVRAINIHASLLPRWRGAAPAARAIEAGDAHTGITIMQMEAGLDTGPMLLAERCAIDAADTTATLTDRLAALGATLIVHALHGAAELTPQAQPDAGVTYAHKLDKREAWLDWGADAAVLARRVRAFDPFPVACSALEAAPDQPIRIWRATAVTAQQAVAGTVLAADAAGVRVACGEGALLITELQRAGGKRLAAREFLAGHPLPIGSRFISPPTAVGTA